MPGTAATTHRRRMAEPAPVRGLLDAPGPHARGTSAIVDAS